MLPQQSEGLSLKPKTVCACRRIEAAGDFQGQNNRPRNSGSRLESANRKRCKLGKTSLPVIVLCFLLLP